MVIKLNLFSNQKAFILFTQIIHAYGAFHSKKSSFKNFDNITSIQDEIKKIINYEKKDDYCEWSDVGLTDSTIRDMNSSVHILFSEYKEHELQKLISSEKYYKKLKHEFKRLYPDLHSEMIDLLNQHIHHINEETKKSINRKQKIKKFSSRFNSFIGKAFGLSEGDHLICTNFFKQLVLDNEISFSKIHLSDISSRFKNNGSLNETDISFLYSLLLKVLECEKKDHSGIFKNICKEAKVEENKRIIERAFIKFNRLKNDYEKVLNNG